jgi:hypothetical protein
MKNIIYSFLTCLFIILPTQAATNFSGGNGTKQNPYLISSKTDMENLAINVNNADYYSVLVSIHKPHIKKVLTSLLPRTFTT